MALAIVATTMGSFAVMEASAVKYTEISTIFEEDYDGETVSANATGTGEVITDETSGNKYIKMNASWNNADPFAYSLPAITQGKISVRFDYMKDAETLNSQSYIVLADSNVNSTKEYLRLLSTNKL